MQGFLSLHSVDCVDDRLCRATARSVGSMKGAWRGRDTSKSQVFVWNALQPFHLTVPYLYLDLGMGSQWPPLQYLARMNGMFLYSAENQPCRCSTSLGYSILTRTRSGRGVQETPRLAVSNHYSPHFFLEPEERSLCISSMSMRGVRTGYYPPAPIPTVPKWP